VGPLSVDSDDNGSLDLPLPGTSNFHPGYCGNTPVPVPHSGPHPTEPPVPPDPGGCDPVIAIESFEVSISQELYAVASVKLIDVRCGPVPGVLVSGVFSGGIVEVAEAVTGDDGVAIIKSRGKNERASKVSFCVDSVDGESRTYDPTRNLSSGCGSN
jgi:hypothetical protein